MAGEIAEMDEKRAEKIDLSTLTKMVDDAIDLTKDARHQSARCRDYYDGNQLTAKQIETLRARNQPETVNNKISSMVDFLKGMELKTRSDPRALPRTPKHERDSFPATDALRYVSDNANFNEIASEVYEDFLIEGPAGISVEVEKTKKGIEVVLYHIPHDRLIFDPYSRDKQKRDSRFDGVVTWMDVDAGKERWPDKEKEIEAAFEKGGNHGKNIGRDDESYDDVPRWYENTSRRRIMVVELYFIHKAVWHRAVFAHDMYLEEPKKSPYKDDDGLPCNPHIIACPKISRKGDHYSPTLGKLPMQDEINARRIKGLDMVTRRQTWSKEGALNDITQFKKEVNDSGGHIQFPPMGELGRDFGFVENGNLSDAQFRMYTDALRDIEALTNASLAAKNETNMSGRALRELSSGRSLEIQPVFDVYSTWRIRVLRAIWDRIRQYWNEEKWIRVTDDQSTTRFVGLNSTMTVKDAVIEQYGFVPPELEGDERLNNPVTGKNGEPLPHNRISDMEVDITIDEVPDIVNLQAEQFEILAELYKVNPEKVPFDALIQMSQLRDKDKLIGGKQTPEQKQKAQQKALAEQQDAQLDEAEKSSRIEKNRAQAADMIARAQQTAIENELLKNFPVAPTSLSL